MQTPGKSASFLTPIGYRNNSCGYCHNKSGSQSKKSQKRFSYYASTASIWPEFYQRLLDRGWRRSGTLLYKPDQRASCCPQYTIRLDSHSFHASREQRQSVNRFNKFILGEEYIKEAARLYPRSRDQAKKRNTNFDLLERVHESEKTNLKTPPQPSHTLEVTLEPDNYTEEKYALFENYQRLVHHEPPNQISKHGFRNFLCSSPLPRSKSLIDGRERPLGSFHQCYRIDGKLIAVGVLDLLPQCVSAVYFMYHESVHQHGFGKVGALREIAFAKEEGYKWWYAGFYIHSCAKMRYKGDYTPQFMLDPESYDWDPLTDELKKRLDETKFLSLSRERTNGERAPEPHSSNNGAADTKEGNDVFEEEEEEEDDDDNDPPVPNSNLALFARLMPGILSKNQLLTEIDLDHIKLKVQGQEAETCDLLAWESRRIDDPNSIKGIIADLVAAVGSELGKEMVVDFN